MMVAPMRLLLAIVALVATSPAQAATYWVHSPAQFQSAVAATQSRGGRIVLLPGRYAAPLVVSGNGPLRIIGRPGAIVRDLSAVQSAEGLRGPAAHQPPRGRRTPRGQRIAQRQAPSPQGLGPRNTLLRPRGDTRLELGLRSAQPVLTLRRPFSELGQLPVVARGGPARDGRAQLVPRLPRLRLRSRPGRLVPDHPVESLRAGASLPGGPDQLAAAALEPGQLRL